MRWLTSLLPRLWANWITLLGTLLTTGAALGILAVLGGWLGELDRNVYFGSFLLLGLPVVFLAGLLLIPLGLVLDHRRRARAGLAAGTGPIADAVAFAGRDRVLRSRLLFFSGVTVLNLVLFTLAGQRTAHHVDSARFCGTTCHSVMQPEWEAYNRSPHSRVACVQCHIGPGASWAVRSKINGLKQVLGVATGDYHRPIPTPVEHLRPSRDTCEQCHWPQKFAGNRLKVFPHYQPDKGNTPAFNVMLLHIGGEDRATGRYEGIHWHVSAATEVRYEVLDAQRRKIGRISVVQDGKVVAEYLPPGPQQPALSVRTMDCIDCHNRPTHIVDLTAKAAVDRALFAGLLDASVPWLARAAAEVLAQPGIPREGAEAALRAALEEKYRKELTDAAPTAAQLDRAAKVLADLYRQNVYPSMKVGWSTYASNLGHRSQLAGENAGCFRCHDKEHEWKRPDGTSKTLSQSCELCHEPLASDEDPAKFEETLQALVRRPPQAR